MSASTFPSLLKRSHIASYDPLITRIYTSSPSAQARGDWGLKSSLPTPRPGRAHAQMIRVGALDAPAVGCDYRSGEKEGRFVQRWGSSRVGWTSKTRGGIASDAVLSGPEPSPVRATLSSTVSRASLGLAPAATSAAQAKWMPDVEAMSEREFQAYLETLRARRPELEQTIKAESPSASTFRGLADHYVTNMQPAEPSRFIADTSSATLSAPNANALHPVPHARGGLAYAHMTPSARDRDPSMALPGRGLNPAPHAHRGGADAMSRAASGSTAVNREGGATIVGVGGLTGSTSGPTRYSARRAGSGSGPTAHVSTIVQGEDPTKSVQRFRLSGAHIAALPRVVAASPAAAVRRELNPESAISWAAQRKRTQRPSPLETARFEVGFTPAREADQRLAASMGNARAVGDREWVGHAYRSPMDAAVSGSNAASRSTVQGPVLQSVEKRRNSLAELQELFKGMQGRKTAAGARSFSTSARRLSDKPTASIPVGSESGEGGISGPGIGGTQDPSSDAPVDDKVQKDEGKAAGDGLAGGKWRQLEENVGGEVRYGNDKARGKGE